MNPPSWKSVLFNGGTRICDFGRKILQKCTIFRNVSDQCDIAINEILFYGSEDEEHMRQVGLDNMLCIHYVILHATKTVDLCVPSLTSDTLAKCLVNVHQKNKVHIRVAIHNSDDFHNLQILCQNGIEVKVIRSGVRLEHEFALVDAGAECEAVAALGALDDSAGSRRATLLTSDAAVRAALRYEFERVWNSVADITHAKIDKTK